MRPRSPVARLAATGLGWLALFSLLFTVGRAVGLWPAPPEGGFHGSDLAVGLVFGVILLASLLRGER